MTKRLLLAIVCLLAISVTAGAQKRERKIKRIDRGVQEKVFIPKGQWLAGGSVSYSEHEEDNLNFLVLKDVEGKGYNFKVSPYVGYFFADNMAAGFRFAYNRTYLDMPNLQLNLGDDLNISLEDLYYLQHRYDVSGFLRRYIRKGKPLANRYCSGLDGICHQLCSRRSFDGHHGLRLQVARPKDQSSGNRQTPHQFGKLQDRLVLD